VIVDKAPSAGFWIRVLARLIDMVLGMLVGVAGGIAATIVLLILNAAGIPGTGWQNRLRGDSLGLFFFSSLGSVLYHFFCEGIHGSTLGKFCCGLRVVSEDGSPSTMKGALIRTLAYAIDSICFGAAGYSSMQKSPLNQRYGDVWGKTAVFKIKGTDAEWQRTPMRFVVGLSLGLGCWMACIALSLILKAM
jgi:uncharacterized RDD family membrane protein YckC